MVVRFLVSGMMIDEVVGHHFPHCVQVSLSLCLQEAAHQYLVPLLSLRQWSVLSLDNVFYPSEALCIPQRRFLGPYSPEYVEVDFSDVCRTRLGRAMLMRGLPLA
jgi:hypothetical protein